jgi:hypothetical protein
MGSPSILFDAGHGEEVTPEEPDLSKMKTLLQANGFKLATLRTTITPAALRPHRVCVLGNPLSVTFSQREVAAAEGFVKAGGGLFMVSGATIFGKGGDQARKTNLNAIAQRFGLGFSDRAVQHSPPNVETVAAIDALVATAVDEHPLTHGLVRLQFASATAVLPGMTSHTLFRIGDAPAAPAVCVADTQGKGRVLALGGSAPFFNAYIGIHDHDAFLVRAFRWLANQSLTASIHRLEKSEPEFEFSPESAEAIKEVRRRLEAFEKEIKEMKDAILATTEELRRVLRALQEGK